MNENERRQFNEILICMAMNERSLTRDEAEMEVYSDLDQWDDPKFN